ncbi:molybdopterin oxidoreductase family protein [Microaerobacter geothermalis]|uniref:molybdopterin-containing oxidoreductase family protein n=1 Tax=Microaerobacter geothermalis TaxID=674972 RepID=UPI001F1CBA2F|nr:molybdopterin oxidoreductase family protein [Microaerobacter geothermalis]MCF6094003.1 molybdopterin oxidoreductase family protein [Microaerobacter geothermalis]
MRQTHINVCPHDCWDTCSMQVTVENGKAVKLRGNPEHPVTKGFLCVKVNHYLDRVYHKDRVLYPMKRIGAKGEGIFERITWNEALQVVTDRFKQIIAEEGPEAILPYSYAGTLGLLNFASMDRRFFNKMGASQLERTICSAAGSVALDVTYGTRMGIDPEDMVYSKLIIVWGVNPLTSNVHQFPIIEEARKRGATFVVIDPYRHETAEKADIHIQPLPGTDSALALGIMHLLIKGDHVDHSFIKKYVQGYDELKVRVEEYTPERTAKITGLREEEIVQLAQLYATVRPSVIRAGYGIQRHTNGGEIIRNMSILPALIGAWEERGGGFLLSNSKAYPTNSDRLTRPDLLQGNPRMINMNQIGEALLNAEPPIKSMYVYNSNPACVAPNQNKVIKGLMREDLFLVVHEQLMTDTAKYADILLPATTQLEHWDIHPSYWHLYIQLNEPAIQPLGEAKPNTEVFRLLAKGMGYTDPCFNDSDLDLIRQALETDHPHYRGITLESLLEKKYIKLNVEDEYFQPYKKGFPTSSGKIEVKSEKVKELGLEDIPNYHPLKESREGNPELYRKYPLAFITPAAKHFLNSTFGNIDVLKRREKEPTVFLHPLDASARGIEDGDQVRVYNDRGECILTARVGNKTRPGVAISPSLWWGKNVNQTTSDALTDMGRGATFHTNLVQVEKID